MPVDDKTTVYCRRCSYCLKGLHETRCPECGSAFDLTDPMTYRTRPRRTWIGKTLAILLIGAGLVLALNGWFGWAHYREQNALAAIRRTNPGVRVESRAIAAPVWLRLLIRDRYLDRVRGLWFHGTATDADLAHVQLLSKLEVLDVASSSITDAGIGRLRGLRELSTVGLDRTQVTDASLLVLKGLPLRRLVLNYTQVTDTGLEHLGKHPTLQKLWLVGANVTDAGLGHLEGTPRLWQLNLRGARITDKATPYLKRMPALGEIILDPSQVTHAWRKELEAAGYRISY